MAPLSGAEEGLLTAAEGGRGRPRWFVLDAPTLEHLGCGLAVQHAPDGRGRDVKACAGEEGGDAPPARRGKQPLELRHHRGDKVSYWRATAEKDVAKFGGPLHGGLARKTGLEGPGRGGHYGVVG